MGRFDSYGKDKPKWMDERRERLQREASHFDPSAEDVIPLAWNGEYYFRILPVENMEDWLMPVGYHWGVFPMAEDEGISKDACPQTTYGEDCPICMAIKKCVGEKVASYKDFGGKNGPTVRKQFLVRVLLISVELEKSGKRKPPVWAEDELPVVKILAVPWGVADTLMEAVDNKRIGWNKLTSPEEGLLVQIIRDATKDANKMYEVNILPEVEPVPEEFLEDDVVDSWPEMRAQLPKLNTKELYAKIEKHQMDIDPRIANAVLAIEAGKGAQKQLKSANAKEEESENEQEESSVEEPVSSKRSLLKEKLAARRNKK